MKNREIKFRAFDDIGKMYFGSLSQDRWYSKTGFLDVSMGGLEGAEIMQFTGLKDKNGKDIYEGDILKGFRAADKYLTEKNWIGSVEYAKVRCAFVLKLNSINHTTYEEIVSIGTNGSIDERTGIDYRYEIIGNIHQNPSFLTPLSD